MAQCMVQPFYSFLAGRPGLPDLFRVLRPRRQLPHHRVRRGRRHGPRRRCQAVRVRLQEVPEALQDAARRILSVNEEKLTPMSINVHMSISIWMQKWIFLQAYES